MKNMKYNLTIRLAFSFQLVNTHALVFQLFKIILHRLNYYFAFLEYKHKFFKTS